MRCRWPVIAFGGMLVGGGLLSAVAVAQTGDVISLAQAKEIALRNHPRIAAASLDAEASAAVVKEVRSVYYPTLAGNATGVGAEQSAVVSAGALTTSSLFSRASTDVVVNQMLTDFGRTASLTESAKLRRASQGQVVNDTRAGVLLEVEQAYYGVLESESILRVARATLNLRSLTLRQISALAQSALRSTLDVSFAQVNVSQAELDLVRAKNDSRAGHVRLAAAMGYAVDRPFSVADESLPPPLDPELGMLVDRALRERPDLNALRLTHDALGRYADAERRLRNPMVSAAAVAGVAPVRDERLPETYSAVGVNVSIPVLNGGLFKARREEAELRAAAAGKDVEDLSLRIARDVQVAWLTAKDAFERLDVTARLVAQATEALRLAQARYDNALGSIVELNQAQLNQVSAEIAAASAKYEYLTGRAALDYAMGGLQ
jgi:outer membrane protein